jgi:hypothetical protein
MGRVSPKLSMSTVVTYLQKVLPGQNYAWYDRIASLVEAGEMALPSSNTVEAPIITTRTRSQPRVVQVEPDTLMVPVTFPSRVTSPTVPCPRASTASEWRVVQLMNGDRPGAERLVARVATNNRGRSGEWCWEKVAFDLERDRH